MPRSVAGSSGSKSASAAYHLASIKEGKVEGQQPALVNLTMLFRDLSVTHVKYRLLANVVNRLAEAPHDLPDDAAKIAPRAVAAPVDTDQ